MENGAKDVTLSAESVPITAYVVLTASPLQFFHF
jgi:hypothetical protein